MRVFTYKVSPFLPERLARLEDLAQNLWWSWHAEAIELFLRLDPALWEAVRQNPVRLVGEVAQERLEEVADDEGFLAHLDRVLEEFDRYLHRRTWFRKAAGDRSLPCIAYFAAEFGLAECLPLYSGGLAVLAGDHLKAASDLGLPLIGVGLLYRKGYFQQYLNEAGWQQEVYPENDFHTMPLRLEERADGRPLTVEVAYPSGPVQAQVWRTPVGQVNLYLLDTDLETNRPEDRQITAHLYGGDVEMRIRQEILLGIGGVRALHQLEKAPTVCHMNEGHSAFMGLERIRLLMEQLGLNFHEAREAVAASNVFTTHTPVPAGIDIFPPELMARYFADYARSLGLAWEEFLSLGQERPGQGFSMAVLALRLSRYNNGVSRLHARVARRMWQGLWPGVPQEEIPIAGTTNGVHFSTWVSHDMALLFDRYLGPHWREEPADPELWQRTANIPAEELWRTHERRRERLIAFVRRRLQEQLRRRGAPPHELAIAREALNPEALTIGFGRRFSTYKRAALLRRDPERLERLLCNPERPVQLVLAGKAHPHDQAGKELIQQVVQLARQERFRKGVVFVEDYDLAVARYLVQGVDLWLNTPRRPQEACGTSGMKAMINGALNLSTLDGWWDEAYQLDLGWSIGCGEEYTDEAYQDEVEGQALYEILEKEIVPLFYQRGQDGLPRGWIEYMKTSLSRLGPVFNAHRMVQEYAGQSYLPADAQWRSHTAGKGSQVRALCAWKNHLRAHWGEIRVGQVGDGQSEMPRVGMPLEVEAEVHLGEIAPQEVVVELYHGRVGTDGQIASGQAAAMEWVVSPKRGAHLFRGLVPCRTSGMYGYAVRIRPRSKEGMGLWEPGLLLWA